MHPAELAARASYGRLLSLVVVRTGDLAGAEDALAEAFLAAVTQWPFEGVPQNPEAWLLTAARRRLVDAARRRSRHDKHAPLLVGLDDTAEGDYFGDERLRLLFVCAHPAIDPAVRTPLMLQTVLGLDAARIATALRVAPKTMGQRLWRAKTKIRAARIPFDVPLESYLSGRPRCWRPSMRPMAAVGTTLLGGLRLRGGSRRKRSGLHD